MESAATELAAALLQGVVTATLALLCWFLYRRYRKPYLAWWTVAWGLYVLRLAAISSFLLTQDRAWLYWHQVATGWTALVLLGAALVFSRGFRWRWRYLPVALFPPLWSYVAIYRIDHFGWAAGPAVGFLSLATLWTGWVFFAYHRRVGSSGGRAPDTTVAPSRAGPFRELRLRTTIIRGAPTALNEPGHRRPQE